MDIATDIYAVAVNGLYIGFSYGCLVPVVYYSLYHKWKAILLHTILVLVAGKLITNIMNEAVTQHKEESQDNQGNLLYYTNLSQAIKI